MHTFSHLKLAVDHILHVDSTAIKVRCELLCKDRMNRNQA